MRVDAVFNTKKLWTVAPTFLTILIEKPAYLYKKAQLFTNACFIYLVRLGENPNKPFIRISVRMNVWII